ncbi:MAG: hypothetical protein ACOYKR_04860 [Sphingobacterium thalpophilum]
MRPLRSRLIYYEIWPQLGKWAKRYRVHIDQHLANFIFQLSDKEVENMVAQNATPFKLISSTNKLYWENKSKFALN